MESRPPIFLVGVPRSGTTLLAAMLASHSRIAGAPETQLFLKAQIHDLLRVCKDRKWPEQAVELLWGIRLFSGERVCDLFRVGREDIKKSLMEYAPSVRSLLDVLMDSQALRQNKPRWIEKTPGHIRHLDFIRSLYPDSPVIRIVRDPRDVALSASRVPWGSSSCIVNLYHWNLLTDLSRKFFDTDKNTLTVRYEDLLLDEVGVLRKICTFIGEEFEETMITERAGSEVVTTNAEPWKNNVSNELDRKRIHAWRNNMETDLVRAAGLICNRGIDEFGYEGSIRPSYEIPVFPLTSEYIENHEQDIISAANHNQLLASSEESNPDAILCAYPRLGSEKTDRLINVIRFVRHIIANLIRGRKRPYVNTLRPPGLGEQICHMALLLFGKGVNYPLKEYSLGNTKKSTV